MTRYRRSPIVLMGLAFIVAAGLLVADGAAAAPTLPPGFPPIGAIPGSKSARFKVVVEGTTTAVKEEDASELIPCAISIHARVEETTTYRRGKGVVMVFDRLGKGPRAPVIVHRVGRRLDATLALVVTTVRTAEGTASEQNPPEGGVCGSHTEDLSQGPDCGKPVKDTVNVGMLYRGSLLSIEPVGFNPLLVIDCPGSDLRPGLDSLVFGWPEQPKVPKFIVPPGVIFGTTKVIARSVESGLVKDGPTSGAIGGLTFTTSDFGKNHLTIRLIRVK